MNYARNEFTINSIAHYLEGELYMLLVEPIYLQFRYSIADPFKSSTQNMPYV